MDSYYYYSFQNESHPRKQGQSLRTSAAFLFFFYLLFYLFLSLLSSSSALVLPPKENLGKSCYLWRRCLPASFTGDRSSSLYHPYSLFFALAFKLLFCCLSVVRNSGDCGWGARYGKLYLCFLGGICGRFALLAC